MAAHAAVLAAPAIVHAAHGGEGDGAGVDKGIRAGLGALGSGDFAAELPLHALGPKQAELLEGFRTGLKLRIGVEAVFILFHIGRDQGGYPVKFFREPAAFKHGLNKLGVFLMIQRQAVFAGRDPIGHGPVAVRAAGNQGVDGGIHSGGGVAAGETAEGQVIIPRNHGQHAVFLIQIIIMHHGARIAVPIAHEIVHRHIHGHRIGIHAGQVAFPQLFQCGDQPGLILFAGFGFGVIEDVGIAVRIVVDILQLHIAAAHAAEAAKPALAALAKGGRGVKAVLIPAGHLRRRGAIGRIGGCVIRGGHAAGEAHPLRQWGERGGRGAVGRGLAIGPVIVFLLELLHIEIPAVAAAAAEAHAVGLIEVARIGAVSAFQKRVLHALHRQIEAPVFAVDIHLRVAAQGRGHAHAAHEGIAPVVLHISRVLNQVIQAELIQSAIGFARLIMVKLHLEAVPVVVILGHGAQRRIPLGADAHGALAFAVDLNRAGAIFLIGAGGDKCVPVVHLNIDAVDGILAEQVGFIGLGAGAAAFQLAGGGQGRKPGGQQQGQRQHGAADAVDFLGAKHGAHPI